MAFVSNVDRLTLGEGVYNNVHGNLNNIVYNHSTVYTGRKRHHEEIGGGPSVFLMENLLEPSRKRRRREESDHEIKIIRLKHLNLTREIGSGPGYFLHTGETKGRAVIIKVFNSGPTVREQLESTVTLSRRLLHPNVLRIEGVSSPASLTHFIAYENAFWKTAEGPLAAALRDDTTRSITLGFKMIEGLSSGMNHLSVQGISLRSLGVENFDVFLDINDRFLISINPPLSIEDFPGDQQPQNNTTTAWTVLNALCQRVLRSANRVLHNENIERIPVIPDTPHQSPVTRKSSSSASLAPPESLEPTSSQNVSTNEAYIPPRREYVWRTIERGQQSLAAIASRMALDLDMQVSSSVNKLMRSDGRRAHRCAGYIREEITLATTISDSAVISHDAPSPLEICIVCHEVVGVREVFRCICGDLNPGSRPTVKCQICNYWSHSDCVRISTDFTCQACVLGSLDTSPQDAQGALPPSTSAIRISDFPGLSVHDEILKPTDEGLAHTAAASYSPSTAGGAVRKRRRTHTSQGLESPSMPPSVVSSDDEGGSDFVGRGGGGASSKFGFGLGRAAGGKFGFRFSPPTATGKGEETALVGGMRHLEMAPPDEAIPDAPVTTQDAQQQQPSQDAQHGSQETSPMGMHAGAGRATIGRSAWGPQDWFSANPRLDPSSTSAAHSVFPPAALAGLGLTSSSSYGSLAPASLVEGGMGEGLHSPPLGSSTSFYTPGGDGGLIAHRSNTAGDLILGAPNAFGPRMNTLHTTLMGPAPPLQVGDHGYGHGHSEAMYDLPFLDLHYFEGGAGVGDAQMQQMQLEGWRGGEALDLARSYAAAV